MPLIEPGIGSGAGFGFLVRTSVSVLGYNKLVAVSVSFFKQTGMPNAMALVSLEGYETQLSNNPYIMAFGHFQ